MKLVLDASAFINASFFDGCEAFTTQEILSELKDLKSKSLADSARASGKLRVSSASDESIERVKKAAEKVGSLKKLSKADLSAAALAFEMKAKLITDDFTLQNLAAHMNLDFEGCSRGRIKSRKVFKKEGL